MLIMPVYLFIKYLADANFRQINVRGKLTSLSPYYLRGYLCKLLNE